MVLPEAVVGSSVTTKVLPALRETTRVCTFGLSNSVILAFGISSVNARSSLAEGLSWIYFASTVTATPYLSGNAITGTTTGLSRGRDCTRTEGGEPSAKGRLPAGFDLEVQPDLRAVLGDPAL